jgi:hypothetical protein
MLGEQKYNSHNTLWRKIGTRFAADSLLAAAALAGCSTDKQPATIPAHIAGPSDMIGATTGNVVHVSDKANSTTGKIPESLQNPKKAAAELNAAEQQHLTIVTKLESLATSIATTAINLQSKAHNNHSALVFPSQSQETLTYATESVDGGTYYDLDVTLAAAPTGQLDPSTVAAISMTQGFYDHGQTPTVSYGFNLSKSPDSNDWAIVVADYGGINALSADTDPVFTETPNLNDADATQWLSGLLLRELAPEVTKLMHDIEYSVPISGANG